MKRSRAQRAEDTAQRIVRNAVELVRYVPKRRYVETTAPGTWCRFLVIAPAVGDFKMPSLVDNGPILGPKWGPEHRWILDLHTGKGGYFTSHGYEKVDVQDLDVNPMFGLFLKCLREHPAWWENIDLIPRRLVFDWTNSKLVECSNHPEKHRTGLGEM